MKIIFYNVQSEQDLCAGYKFLEYVKEKDIIQPHIYNSKLLKGRYKNIQYYVLIYKTKKGFVVSLNPENMNHKNKDRSKS